MNATLFPAAELSAPPAAGIEAVAFQIGWDHAHHGLVPPAELLLDGSPVGQGWRAGRAVFGRRTLAAQRATRAWLALRVRAWLEGAPFETQFVNAHYVGQLDTARCPVLRTLLGGSTSAPEAAELSRLNPAAGYAAGNLATLSRAANERRRGLALADLQRRARTAALTGENVEGLDAGAWWRLAALQSYATPLPFHEAARLPLAVLPPNRTRLLNAAQGLQALLTRQFLAPGWSARTRAFAEMLPAHTLRQDFNLFIGALAPRVLEAGRDEQRLRLALEDAWLGERVQRRWQHFVMSLGEAGTQALLERAVASGLAGVRTLHHAPEQATEGWALPPAAPAPRSRARGAERGQSRRCAPPDSSCSPRWKACSTTASAT